MSNYIQALKRLGQDGQLAGTAVVREPVRRAERGVRDVGDAPAARPTPAIAATPRSSGAAETAALLDRLRTLAALGETTRVLVFAPAGPGASARAVVDGLAARARELAMEVAVGELGRGSGGQAALVERGSGRGADVARAPRPIDLDGTALADGLRAWLEPHAASQLVLIEAPAVTTSADALLLAGVCDGLVLIARRGNTERETLRIAAERARGGRCRTLGVVLTHE